MNVTKWMRKYGNVLLMIFMAILLVAFLLPPQMFQGGGGGRPGSRDLGSVFGEPVTSHDAQRAQVDAEIAQILGFTSVNMFGRPMDVLRNVEPTHQVMLLREAERSGVQASIDEVKELLSLREDGAEAVARVRERYNVSYDDIYAACARWRAVMRLAGAQQEAAGPSLPRLKRSFVETSQEADVQSVALPASAFIDDVGEPTDEQLQAFFEEAKRRTTQHTQEELVYGYLQPDQVKLEYITVNPDRIAPLIRVRQSEARDVYERRPEVWTRTLPGAEGQPGTEVQLTFEEAEEQIKQQLREQRAIEAAQRLVNELQIAANQAWLGRELGEDGFRAMPPQDVLVDFETLAQRPENEYPVRYESTEFLSASELQRMPNLGQASVRQGSGRLTAAELAFNVPGLFSLPEDATPGSVPTLNLYQPSPVMVETPRQRGAMPRQSYFFRVVDVKPSAPPESLDAIEGLRATVVRDWKTKQAFAIAEEQAQLLAEQAQDVGLQAAVAQADILRQMMTTINPNDPTAPPTPAQLNVRPVNTFSRQRHMIPGIGSIPGLAERVFALESPADAPLAERVMVEAAAPRQAWVVLQVNGIAPVYEERFEQQRPRLISQTMGMDVQLIIFEWFNPERIEQRTEWAPATPPDEAA